MRTLLAAALVALSAHPVFTVHDDRIEEASGLVDLGSLSVVANDSGDSGRLFVLDGEGRTVGVTDYQEDATDVEALAPAGGSAVWVGDIGDNDAKRPWIEIRRVQVGRGDRKVRAESHRLVYPDGAHDAETLLRDPRDGRLYVVTKSVTGGTVYAAPERLGSGNNRLTRIGRVPVWATDGAFTCDGSQLLLRGYTALAVVSFPSLEVLASYGLPEQPQGESLSVGPGDRVRIGTEGEHEPVLQLDLPSTTPEATPTPSPGVISGPRPGEPSGTNDPRPVLIGLAGAAALVAAITLLWRRRRAR